LIAARLCATGLVVSVDGLADSTLEGDGVEWRGKSYQQLIKVGTSLSCYGYLSCPVGH